MKITIWNVLIICIFLIWGCNGVTTLAYKKYKQPQGETANLKLSAQWLVKMQQFNSWHKFKIALWKNEPNGKKLLGFVFIKPEKNTIDVRAAIDQTLALDISFFEKDAGVISKCTIPTLSIVPKSGHEYEVLVDNPMLSGKCSGKILESKIGNTEKTQIASSAIKLESEKINIDIKTN